MSGWTKDAGNNPIRPERWCCPLYQPFSRFFITNTISPTRNSNSYSLFGGYGTIHRNLPKGVCYFYVEIWSELDEKKTYLSRVLLAPPVALLTATAPLLDLFALVSPDNCTAKLVASRLWDFRWWLLPWFGLTDGGWVADTLIMDVCGLVAWAFRKRLLAALIVKSTLVRRLKRARDYEGNCLKKRERKLTVPLMDVPCVLWYVANHKRMDRCLDLPG